jgi:deazaflavin-dependent oxidoreductase (nitroreductase family)
VRALRPAVLSCKGDFGSDSAAGSHFAERLLTVIATRRQQRRHLPGFLIAAGEAARQRNWSPLAPAFAAVGLNDYMPGTPDRPHPSWLNRHILRVPVLLYRLGLGPRLEQECLILTTTGRRTGRPHSAALDYVEADGRIYVFAGYGARSDWYRNVLARPEVIVLLGRRRLRGRARPIEDPGERRRLLGLHRDRALAGLQGPPRAIRALLKGLGILDFNARVERAFVLAEHTPTVEVTPLAEG